MEWNIGVEMRNEYRRMELARAAMKLVRDIMLCKPGENLVITYDTCVDERVVHALTEAAYTIESVPTVIYYPTAEGFYADPPKPVADAIAAADVWIELTYARSCMDLHIAKQWMKMARGISALRAGYGDAGKLHRKD